jgi:hypothetical protein
MRAEGLSDRAPDFVEPLEAWRVWRVVRRDGRLELASLIQASLRPSREALAAICLNPPPLLRRVRRRPAHDAPTFSCDCGIYATSLERIGFYLSESPRTDFGRVFGVVSLWGSVVECRQDYRASRAYPARIYLPQDASHRSVDGWEEVASGLEHYGVPIEEVAARSRAAVKAVADQLASRPRA